MATEQKIEEEGEEKEKGGVFPIEIKLLSGWGTNCKVLLILFCFPNLFALDCIVCLCLCVCVAIALLTFVRVYNW